MIEIVPGRAQKGPHEDKMGTSRAEVRGPHKEKNVAKSFPI